MKRWGLGGVQQEHHPQWFVADWNTVCACWERDSWVCVCLDWGLHLAGMCKTPSLAMTQAFNSTMMHGYTVIAGTGGKFLSEIRERTRLVIIIRQHCWDQQSWSPQQILASAVPVPKNVTWPSLSLNHASLNRAVSWFMLEQSFYVVKYRAVSCSQNTCRWVERSSSSACQHAERFRMVAFALWLLLRWPHTCN